MEILNLEEELTMERKKKCSRDEHYYYENNTKINYCVKENLVMKIQFIYI
jgi:hypothetical protein